MATMNLKELEILLDKLAEGNKRYCQALKEIVDLPERWKLDATMWKQSTTECMEEIARKALEG